MKTILHSVTVLVILSISLNSAAQTPAKPRDIFLDAEFFLITGEYQEALLNYLKLYQSDQNNANICYRIGMCYLNIRGEKIKSIPFLQQACNNISEKYVESTFQERKAPVQSLFLLATAYQINYQFDEAMTQFNRYKKYLGISDVYEMDFIDQQIAACEYAKLLLKQPLHLESAEPDFIPAAYRKASSAIVSSNEEMAIFLTEEKFYKAIWMVRKSSGRWLNPVNITSQLQSDGDLYPNSLTSDGKVLYLSKLNSYGADIYFSQFNGTVWEPAIKLDKPVNTKYWESHAAISSDGSELYFVSDRKGGFGNLDIYFSKRDDKGKWSEPANLGENINTPFDEDTPFICEDNVTLFFSSQGHLGMGGLDVFKSTRQDDQNWSVPVNLGYPVNSSDDDLFYFPLQNGQRALFQPGLTPGGLLTPHLVAEINILLSEKQKTISLKGTVITEDRLNQLDESFVVYIMQNKGRDTLFRIKPDPRTGSFSQNISTGEYEISSVGRGYKSLTEYISLPQSFNRAELMVNLNMVPDKVESGEYVIMKNILFDYNSFDLSEKARMELERLFQLMLRYPELSVEIIGHTDSRGSASYNYTLSRKRASAVVEHLINKGIDARRFAVIAHGEFDAIASNFNPDGTDNPEGRRYNRNAEIRILQPEQYKVQIEPIPIPDHLKASGDPQYTILLTRSDIPLDNSTFSNIHFLSEYQVNETYAGSSYIYTLGSFFTRTPAEELIKSGELKRFSNAQVVHKREIQGFGGSSNLSDETRGFAIQLAATRKPAALSQFKKIGEVRQAKSSDGYYKVLYGNFDTYEAASSELERVWNAGFSDAFITGQPGATREKGSPDAVNAGSEVYTIQVVALRTQVGSNYFSRLDDIRVVEGDDGFFRYIYGEYTNLGEARNELERIRSLGYQDAFIRNIKNLPGY